jgi:hypothetical protein
MTATNYTDINTSTLIKTLEAIRQLSIQRESIQQQHTQLSQKLIPTLQTILQHGGSEALYKQRNQLQSSILNLVAKQNKIETLQAHMTNHLLNQASHSTLNQPDSIASTIPCRDSHVTKISSPHFRH